MSYICYVLLFLLTYRLFCLFPDSYAQRNRITLSPFVLVLFYFVMHILFVAPISSELCLSYL